VSPVDPLEQTQEIDTDPNASGVFRWQEPQGPWNRAPELSVRYEFPQIDFTRRQAE
jgi:hypothetical protein